MFEQLKLRHVDQSQYKKHLDPLLARINNNSTKDHISHFVLRLAYCRTEDLRRWFLAQEVALLKWRLGHSAAGSTTQALADVLPEAKLIPQKELEASKLMSLILASTPNIKLETKIYQVPFTHALDLVQHRQVFVRRGMAYIPESKLVHLVTARFRASLSRQLVLLSAVPTTPGLQRTQGFLKNVATVHAIKDQFQTDGDSISDLNASNVPAHIKHMPLCMAQLQMGLQKEKHLKHWGRLQYGLFLKGAGLSLEDALTYFERMFVGKGFSKEYAYNWRHMYGKEGKRANYPAYSCAKVINSNAPNANEHHGCPFKHGSVQEVTTLLGRLGVNPQQQKGIIAQQQSHNYQLACVEHFKVTHPNAESNSNVQTDNLGNHPNAWFHSSLAYELATGGGDSKKGDKKAGTPAMTATPAGKKPDVAQSATSVSP
jgi:DNA primase large subunit